MFLKSADKKHKKKIKCEGCGIFFSCYGSNMSDCWCFSVPIVKIKKNITNCLCKKCLSENHYYKPL